jgi:hypothetical protein
MTYVLTITMVATLSLSDSSSTCRGDEASDAAAVLAIKELGGSVRRVAVNDEHREVEFQLSGRGLTDEGLVHVAALENNVVTLHLDNTKITSAGLAHLKGLTKLRRLHLERTEVGDEGIQNLQGLTELEYLNLYATNITDKSLLVIQGLKKLKHLYLWQTDVSDEAVLALEEKLPELRVVRGASFNLGAAARKRILIDDPALPVGGKPWTLAGIRYDDENPGPSANGKIYFRNEGATEFTPADMTRDKDGRFEATIPAAITSKSFQYYILIREPKKAPSTYPPAGAKDPAKIKPDTAPPTLAEAPQATDIKSYLVTISWKAATDDLGVTGYNVYRGNDEQQTVAAGNLLAKVDMDQLQFIDKKPPTGETVFYAVEPIDVAKQTGAAKLISIAVPPNTPPTNNLKLTASAGSNAVVLNWTGETEADVEQVIVFRSDAEKGELTQVAELNLTGGQTWIDKDVKDDIKYRYHIKLRDSGELLSGASGEVIGGAGGYIRRINCGGLEVISPDGANWKADVGRVTGTGRFTAKTKIAGCSDELQLLYQTERWAYSGLRYRFDAPPGNYRLTLHFAETNNSYGAVGKRTFDVVVNDEKLGEAVDVFANAGKGTAWKLDIDFEQKGEEVVVDLKKVKAGPAIKGIELREVSSAATPKEN